MKNYSDHNIRAGMECLQSGRLSVKKAVKEHDVPRSTLLDHLTGKVTLGA